MLLFCAIVIFQIFNVYSRKKIIRCHKREQNRILLRKRNIPPEKTRNIKPVEVVGEKQQSAPDQGGTAFRKETVFLI